MTLEEFKTSIYSIEKPTHWREGQFVFNIASKILGDGIVRQVQFEDGIDCFYDDTKIDDFINACNNRINGN